MNPGLDDDLLGVQRISTVKFALVMGLAVFSLDRLTVHTGFGFNGSALWLSDV